jgi:uncharacterized membrane protein
VHNKSKLVLLYVLTLAGILVWLGGIILAPWLRSRSSPLTPLLYACFAPVCHQIPERSFALFGFPLAVCARCFGIYAGFLAGMVLYPIRRGFTSVHVPKTAFFLAISAPIVCDTAANVLGLWHSPNTLRFFLGLLWGGVLPFYFLTGLGELAFRAHKK